MADDKRATEKCFDAIIIDMHPQALTDQLRRRAVEDAFDQEAARPGNWHDNLGEVCGPPLWQWLEVNPLRLDGVRPLPVAPCHKHVDEAPIVFDGCKFAAATQDQGRCDGGLAMPVLRFHRAVLMSLAPVVATGLHAVVPDKGFIAQGNILTLVSGQVTDR